MSRFRAVLTSGIAALAVVAAVSPSGAAGARDLLLGSWWAEFGPQDITLASVPFEPGAPAIVLLAARQDSWAVRGVEPVHQLDGARRIKILTEDGARRFGTYRHVFTEPLRSNFIEARTVLPDGRSISAEVKRTISEDGWQQFEVAFPSVQVGAILDVHWSMVGRVRGDFSVEPWVLDQDLPVLESRYIFMPPPGLEWNAAFSGDAKAEPRKIVLQVQSAARRSGRRLDDQQLVLGVDGFLTDAKVETGFSAYAWRYTDRKAIVREPFSPPGGGPTSALYILPRHMVHDKAAYDIVKAWPTWIKAATQGWEFWLNRERASAEQLAKSVVAAEWSDVGKAEAIGAALRARFEVLYYGSLPSHATPEIALARGKGSANELTALATIMLRSVGVKATMALTRHPTDGDLVKDFALPITYNDSLVQIGTSSGPLYWNVRSPLPIRDVPAEFAGAYVIPLDGETTGPVALDVLPARVVRTDRVQRTIKGNIDRTGVLEADVSITLSGDTADTFRERFRRGAATEHPDMARALLGPRMTGGEITALRVDNLPDPAKDLVVAFHWQGAIGRVDGTRLVLPSGLGMTAALAEWPDAPRQNDIFFGSRLDVVDSMQIVLPEGATKVAGPAPAQHIAAGVGKFEGNCDSWSRKLVGRRSLRIERPRFPVALYIAVRELFSVAARFDAETITIETGPAS